MVKARPWGALSPTHATLQRLSHYSGMQVFIFKSSSDSRSLAFTPDRDGTNLPSAHGPWRLLGGNREQASHDLSGVGISDRVVAGIVRDGYYVTGRG